MVSKKLIQLIERQNDALERIANNLERAIEISKLVIAKNSNVFPSDVMKKENELRTEQAKRERKLYGENKKIEPISEKQLEEEFLVSFAPFLKDETPATGKYNPDIHIPIDELSDADLADVREAYEQSLVLSNEWEDSLTP